MSRIKLVKPEKARAVEDMILRAAQSGQLGGKVIVRYHMVLTVTVPPIKQVDEPNLISLLGQLSQNTAQPKITVCPLPPPPPLLLFPLTFTLRPDTKKKTV